MKNLSVVLALVLIILAFWGLFKFSVKDQDIENKTQEDEVSILEQELFDDPVQINDEVLKNEKNMYSIGMNTEQTQAIFTTNYGSFTLELYPDKAPKTVENFIKLSQDGFYNNTKFHRVIADFMIQGGDPLSKDDSKMAMWGSGGPGYTFEDEQNDVALVQGVFAMANAGPNTNGSQFFIITAESTPWLQGKHTGFGKVVSGMDVVMKIGAVATGQGDRPVDPVIVQSVIVN